uniref:Ribosome assembly factor mrt4 n=1 Tax=Otolemur garnettii TaxID=30611 RepID=H0XY09_OTOGA
TPTSECDEKVSLTKTAKKGLELKQNPTEELQTCVDTCRCPSIFSVTDVRTRKLKGIRNAWKHSLMFFGKNKVMTVALGRTLAAEYKDRLHQVSKKLGKAGLLLTSCSKDEVNESFMKYTEINGLSRELDPRPLEQFPHSLAPQLKWRGLPAALRRGVGTLLEGGKEGNVLSSEQARVMKLFGYEMAEFSISIKYMWDVEQGRVQGGGGWGEATETESSQPGESESDEDH